MEGLLNIFSKRFRRRSLSERREEAEMSSIDVLRVDELLIIFNLLSLYDKLIVMRVCKKWHDILTKPSAWQVINFYDEGPDEENEVADLLTFVPNQGVEPIVCKIMEKWQFPRGGPKKISEFLSCYAGIALQELHIPKTSIEIKEILQKNCPNVHTVSYRHGFLHSGDQDEILYLPSKLKRLKLESAPFSEYERDSYRSYWEHRGTIGMFDDKTNLDLQNGCLETLNRLSMCKMLKYLTLKGCWLCHASMQTLVENLQLKGIDILTCLPVGINREMIKSRQTMKNEFVNLMDNILSPTIGSMKSMNRFRLIGSGTRVHYLEAKYPGNDVVNHLIDCIGRWTHLKYLTLKYVSYSSERLAQIIPGLPDLISLELEDCISSEVVTLIGTHLRKLEFLSLQGGEYDIESLRSLSYHPTLRILWILHDWNLADLGRQFEHIGYCRSIYDVLITIPNLKKVSLRGYIMGHLFQLRESYPGLESIQIEIQDKDKHHFGWDLSSTMHFPFDPLAHIVRGPLSNC